MGPMRGRKERIEKTPGLHRRREALQASPASHFNRQDVFAIHAYGSKYFLKNSTVRSRISSGEGEGGLPAG